MILYDIKRIIKSPLFIFLFLVLVFGLIMGAYPMLQTIKMLKSYLINPAPDVSIETSQKILGNVSGFEIFKNSLYNASSSFFAVIIPLFSGLLFSGDFCYQKNTGFGNFIVTRMNFKKYYSKKVASTFIFPFIIIAILLSLYLLLCLIIFSCHNPKMFSSNYNSDFESLYYNTPFLFSTLSIIHFSIYGSIYSLIGLCAANFTSNRFLIAVSPFFIYITLTIGTQAVHAQMFKWLFPDSFIFFLTNKLIVNNLPPFIQYQILLLLYLFPITVLLIFLYKKNIKNYIR